MRKLFTIVVAVLLMASVFLPQQAGAQSPEKMSYQAVIRDSDDNLITDTQVGMQISILQGSASGKEVYAETQEPTTNTNGLVSLEIGTGTTSDDFSAIDWANGSYFIKTETDPTGGSSYTITGTSQLLSVPYAFHAKTAEPETYEIGDFAHGGVVFYVESCGTKGLVVAIEDQSTGIKWRGGGDNYFTMASGDEIYAGKMNTSIIISVHSAKDDTDEHAASVCANYDGGGFGDWYLPSKEELNLIYQNKTTIETTATSNGGSGFANDYYYSSTEDESYSDRAWSQHFENGSQGSGKKYGTNYARAVRAF